MKEKEPHSKPDRKLGDEWADWDGQAIDISSDTDGRVFIGMSFAAIVFIIGAMALFGWLIYPRLKQMGDAFGTVFNISYFAISAILILWLVLFIWGVAAKRPFLSGLIIIPKLVNLLLGLTIRIGRLIGVSPERLFNSFIKLHNLILDSDPKRVNPDKMLILLPRCLTKEMNKELRNLRDKYGFKMASAGGGGEARQRIREARPSLVIAVACERDLLTGFIDVNPHIPVLCFPNVRPCGPCKNTEVNLSRIEETVQRHLVLS